MKSHSKEMVVRFTVGQRLEHLLLMVTFTMLCLTGLPQKMHDAPWAASIINALGGIEQARLYLFPLLRAGAAGYLLKKAAGTDLVAAIRSIAEGGTFLHPSVAGAVVEGYVRSSDHGDGLERLTERETQVLGLVAEGLSNQEIADRLVLSVKTVMGHRGNVMQKLGLHNRTELVKYAIRNGLVRVDT